MHARSCVSSEIQVLSHLYIWKVLTPYNTRLPVMQNSQSMNERATSTTMNMFSISNDATCGCFDRKPHRGDLAGGSSCGSNFVWTIWHLKKPSCCHTIRTQGPSIMLSLRGLSSVRDKGPGTMLFLGKLSALGARASVAGVGSRLLLEF